MSQQPLSNSDKASLIRNISELPAIPKVAQLILQEISDENVDIGKLSRVIEMDPGLVARIVGLANSAFFGCNDRIYSVSDAIIKVLGLNTVRSLSLSIVLSMPFRVEQCAGFKLNNYWLEAMLSASIVKELSPNICATKDEADFSMAYVCGLLHNIGLLVLVHQFKNEMAGVFRRESNIHSEAFMRAEESLLGLNHAQAGGILARKWHIPENIIAVIENNHNSSYQGDYWKMSLVVGISSRVANSIMMSPDKISMDSSDVLKRICVSPQMIERVVDKIKAQRDGIESLARIMAMA